MITARGGARWSTSPCCTRTWPIASTSRRATPSSWNPWRYANKSIRIIEAVWIVNALHLTNQERSTVRIWNPDKSEFWMVKEVELQSFEWDLKSGRPTNWNLNKWALFCQKPFEIQTKTCRFWMVQSLNGWDYSCSHWHLKSVLQKVRISNGLISDPHSIFLA